MHGTTMKIHVMSGFCNCQRSKRLYYAVRLLNGISQGYGAHTVHRSMRSDLTQCSIRHEMEKASLYNLIGRAMNI